MSDQPYRILVVDDSPEDRELYRRLLAREGETRYVFLETDSGVEGLRLCETERPDCILLDYRVPDLDGLQFVSELNSRDGRLAVPLVMVTGQGDESVAVRAMKAGARDYLVKGTMTGQELRRAIDNAIEKGVLHRTIEQQRAEIEQSAKLLREKHAELEQFAYVASHDLQEPLRMITSYLQLLERRYQGKLDADADRFIGYAVDGAGRMRSLISDLLALSRVESRGKELAPTDCQDVLRGSLENLQIAVQESNAEITHDPLPVVMADATQLGQLFQNLIANALKFRAAAPRIHVGAERDAEQWVLSVRDNGIGFDPQFGDRIFVIFQRLHTRAEYPGTGIGLSICKKIVQRHGGRIWAESEPGQGAVFRFSLQAVEPAARPARAMAAEGQEPPGHAQAV